MSVDNLWNISAPSDSAAGNKTAEKDIVKGVFVPAAVLQRKELTPTEQMFLSKIKDLCTKYGYCDASNNFFGRLFGMTAGRVSQIIARLSEMKFIVAEIDGGNGKRYSRKIFLTDVSEPLFQGVNCLDALNIKRGYIFTAPKGRIYRASNSDYIDPMRHSKKKSKNLLSKNINVEQSPPLRLSRLLFSLIRQRDENAPEPDFQKWAVHIDRLIRIDRRAPALIERVIRWVQDDPFWKNNILSTLKLRKQFPQLFLKFGDSQHGKFKPRHKEDFTNLQSEFGISIDAG